MTTMQKAYPEFKALNSSFVLMNSWKETKNILWCFLLISSLVILSIIAGAMIDFVACLQSVNYIEIEESSQRLKITGYIFAFLVGVSVILNFTEDSIDRFVKQKTFESLENSIEKMLKEKFSDVQERFKIYKKVNLEAGVYFDDTIAFAEPSEDGQALTASYEARAIKILANVAMKEFEKGNKSLSEQVNKDYASL